MGLTTTFVFTRERGAWRGVDDRSLEDVASLPGSPLLAAHVEDSDWCVVLGRDPHGSEWSWVFGEDVALAFESAHRWLTTLDPDELDDSLLARAAETGGAVVAWASACGLGEFPVDAAIEVLLGHDALAETGWWRLLDLVGLADVPREEVEDAGLVPTLGDGPRPIRPPRAIALDHDHLGWRRLNAGELLGRFGAPPCLVEWRHNIYLATDPPLLVSARDGPSLARSTGATGEWRTVPQEAAGSLAAAAAWARAHVGITGAPTPPDRPPLLFEVIDHERQARLPRHRRASEWRLHEPAPRVSALLVVAWREADPEVVGELVAAVHERVIGELVRAFTDDGRGVVYGEEAAPGPWDLQVAGEVVSARGRIRRTTASLSAWSKLVEKVRRGEVIELDVRAIRSTGLGTTRPRHAAATVSHHLRLVDDREDLDVDDEEHQDSPLPKPPWLAVGVDAEFAAVLPLSSLLDLLDRLAEQLPAHHAALHVGRFQTGIEPWLLVQPVDDPWDQAVYPESEVRGALRWLRASVEPPDFEPRMN
jgi:hypothetical protein